MSFYYCYFTFGFGTYRANSSAFSRFVGSLTGAGRFYLGTYGFKVCLTCSAYCSSYSFFFYAFSQSSDPIL